MPSVSYEQFEKLAKQINSMIRMSGGFERFVEVLFKAVAKQPAPSPSLVASDPRTGKEVVVPSKSVDIPQPAWDLLFSEDPKLRSLWYLVNIELGEATLRLGNPLGHTTSDELRILKDQVSKAPTSPDVERVKKRLAEIEERTRPFEVPDIGVK